RNNTIIAYAPPDTLAIIEQAVKAIDVPRQRDHSLQATIGRTEIYHLSTMDPEPLVNTLNEIGNLDLDTRLEVDRENKTITAYATLADHVTIRALIDKLDSTGRQPEVIKLRRLEADYVAGTIRHVLFGGQGEEKKEKKQRYSYWDYDYSSRRSSDNSKKDQFRVDADVEHNRLLLWANKVEMEEVTKFLVKLGENPSQDSNCETVRVLDSLEDEEAGELLDQLRRVWPGKNPLLIDDPKPKKPATDRQTNRSTQSNEDWLSGASQNTPDRPRVIFAQLPSEPATKASPTDSTPPPITITRNAAGRLVIASEDTQALDRLEELVAKLNPPRNDFETFRLKRAWAFDVVDNLKSFFKTTKGDVDLEEVWWSGWHGDAIQKNDDDDSIRLSKRRRLTFIADADSNSILVKGADSAQLKTIRELIAFYDGREEADPRNDRMEGVFHLEYSKARVVADTLKEVYRDLLSSNDKAFSGKKNGNKRSDYVSYYYRRSGSDSDDEPEKAPKFKGLLSIGIDELSNSLIVSAPAWFYGNVAKMIQRLDEMAKPTVATVSVVKLDQGVDAAKLRAALARIIGDTSGTGKAASKEASSTKGKADGAPLSPKH
ncbi:MAG: hypothetical protein JW888_05070, partial [Pirellulales bacterium]|nr:hypothetical protein [Pirellulales bacterium]